MAFKVKILNLDSVLKRIENLFEKDAINEKLITDITELVTTRVVAQTRSGKDLSRDGKPQPALSESTIRIRYRNFYGKTKPDAPTYFKPDKQFFRIDFSNLTATGQMLDSIKGRFVKSTKQIIVEPTGNRDPSLQNNSEFKTNKELAKDLANRGRTFLGLDRVGIQRVRKLILEEIIKFKKRRGFR